MGWGLYFQVVGEYLATICDHQSFLPQVVGTLKPSITFTLLPLLPAHSLTPPCPQLTPLAPLSPSLLPLTPSLLPSLPLPLAPTEVVGTLKHSITYPSLLVLPSACSPCSQLAPLAHSSLSLLPACSPCSSLPPACPPLPPACSPSPLDPTEVVGTLKIV